MANHVIAFLRSMTVVNKSAIRIPVKRSLLLTALLFLSLLVPSRGWASTGKNCPAEPAQRTAIASGGTYYGSDCVLRTTGDVDSFVFNGQAGDIYRMVVAGPSVGYPNNICLDLYGPKGYDIAHGCSNSFYGVTSFSADQPLSVNGTYTMVVTETQDGATEYGLSLELLHPAPPDAVALLLDRNIAAGINEPTAQGAFTFYGETTGTYNIAGSLTAGSYPSDLCFDIVQPDGTKAVHGLCTNTFYGVTTLASSNLLAARSIVWSTKSSASPKPLYRK